MHTSTSGGSSETLRRPTVGRGRAHPRVVTIVTPLAQRRSADLQLLIDHHSRSRAGRINWPRRPEETPEQVR
jgi:hypothetical protein